MFHTSRLVQQAVFDSEFSANKLCIQMGIYPNYLAKIKSGIHLPSGEFIEILSKGLNIPVERLLEAIIKDKALNLMEHVYPLDEIHSEKVKLNVELSFPCEYLGEVK